MFQGNIGAAVAGIDRTCFGIVGNGRVGSQKRLCTEAGQVATVIHDVLSGIYLPLFQRVSRRNLRRLQVVLLCLVLLGSHIAIAPIVIHRPGLRIGFVHDLLIESIGNGQIVGGGVLFDVFLELIAQTLLLLFLHTGSRGHVVLPLLGSVLPFLGATVGDNTFLRVVSRVGVGFGSRYSSGFRQLSFIKIGCCFLLVSHSFPIGPVLLVGVQRMNIGTVPPCPLRVQLLLVFEVHVLQGQTGGLLGRQLYVIDCPGEEISPNLFLLRV